MCTSHHCSQEIDFTLGRGATGCARAHKVRLERAIYHKLLRLIMHGHACSSCLRNPATSQSTANIPRMCAFGCTVRPICRSARTQREGEGVYCRSCRWTCRYEFEDGRGMSDFRHGSGSDVNHGCRSACSALIRSAGSSFHKPCIRSSSAVSHPHELPRYSSRLGRP